MYTKGKEELKDSVGIRKAELAVSKSKKSISYEYCRSNIMGFFPDHISVGATFKIKVHKEESLNCVI